MNDKELKIAVAKMLPEMILASEEDVIVGFISQDECEHEKRFVFRWKNTNNSDIKEDWFEITDKEWLHVCWLIEETLDDRQCCLLIMELGGTIKQSPFSMLHKSWQQRAAALVAVKGEK